MATPVIMPRQGQSVESCIISKWLKQVGDTVNEGEILFSYETDKASFEEEAKVSGTLLAIFAKEDDDVPCLQNVCVIGNPGESFAEFDPNSASAEVSASTEAAPAEEAKAETAKVEVSVASEAKENVFISPRAKNLADRLGVDYRLANGSGPDGRVIERDVQAMRDAGIGLVTPAARAAGITGEGTGIGGRVSTAAAAAPAESAPAAPAAAPAAAASALPMYEDVKMPNIRKVIAKTMMTSMSSMCQLTYNATFDATCILNFRKRLKESAERLGLANISLNDIMLYAVSRVVKNHKDLNANLINGDTMRYFNVVNLGVAVETPRGLMVPTIMNADSKSLNEISMEVKELAAKCKEGSISPDLLTGASFTVSNLGSMGIESFTPVINPPQTGILGVGGLMHRVRPGKNGEIEMYQAMGLSLTCDHRAIDGTPSAKFLKDLSQNLENFDLMFVK